MLALLDVTQVDILHESQELIVLTGTFTFFPCASVGTDASV
jgi:hypothetical protein